jgi:hypothetical protein
VSSITLEASTLRSITLIRPAYNEAAGILGFLQSTDTALQELTNRFALTP